MGDNKEDKIDEKPQPITDLETDQVVKDKTDPQPTINQEGAAEPGEVEAGKEEGGATEADVVEAGAEEEAAEEIKVEEEEDIGGDNEEDIE